MPVPTTPCCTAVLNQQQEETVQYHNQCSDTTITPCKNTTGRRTTIEDGRVVVRPLAPTPIEQD